MPRRPNQAQNKAAEKQTEPLFKRIEDISTPAQLLLTASEQRNDQEIERRRQQPETKLKMPRTPEFRQEPDCSGAASNQDHRGQPRAPPDAKIEYSFQILPDHALVAQRPE